jgi:hypothetical protein
MKTIRTFALLSAVTGFGLMAGVAPANAAFNLGAFDYYGLLVNDGVAGGDINTPPVNANVGVGNITGSIDFHNEVVNGEVDYEVTSTGHISGGAITGTQPASLGGPAPASVNSNVARVALAIAAAQALSTHFGGEAGTAVTFGGNVTINANNGVLDADGNRIFTATNALSIGNGNAITVNGSASDYVVIDVATSNGNKLDGALTLSGGITADHVIVNFTGSGQNLQGAANGAHLAATFLAPDLGIQLNSLTIDGRLFGGNDGTNFQFVSNSFINQPPLVPEPETWALFLAGFGLLGAAMRTRRASAGRLPA